jgi:serine/threonine kinase 38
VGCVCACVGELLGMESEMADAPAAAIPAAAAEPLAAVAEEGEGEAEGEAPAEAAVGSTLTMERVAAAKKFIENHYRSQMKTIQERKERYCTVPAVLIP